MKDLRYKRVVIKISGEALAPQDNSSVLDAEKLETACKQLIEAANCGCQVGVVVGAGNIWRGRQSGKMNRVRADSMGMLATAINALALQDTFIEAGLDTKVMTAVEMQTFADKYSTREAVAALEEGAFRATAIEAVTRAYEKTEALGK